MNLGPGFPTLVRPGQVAPSRRLRRQSAARPDAVISDRRKTAPAAGTAVVYITSVLSGLAFAGAWLVPETVASAILGWVAAALLIYGTRARKALMPAYCCGLALHAVGFYWIYTTVADFGGYGPVVSGLIFALYVVTGAHILLIFAWSHHNLGPTFDAFALRSPTAIVVAELVTVRLFHWHFGHTQVAFTPFVQIAGIGGAPLVSFVMFWVAEACVRVVMFREWRPTFLLPAVALAISVGYGAVMMRTLGAPGGEMQEIVLVQGPPSLSEKRDIDSIWHNGARLYELSRSAARKGSLIIWPEGAVPAYLPAELTSARNEPCLPWLHDGSAFLVGSFAVDAANRRYNTAFAIYADGSVPPPYFKRTLIPFGEYMPFSSVVPWLNKLNDKAGLFSPGHEIQVYSYAMERPDGRKYTARAAPLICYEDTITGPAREATLRGAEVLINLTYDTWFGRSAAPYQHHLIAIFRAIENRRFLVRSTYTGYTAVVSPLGKTIAHIPPFAEGTLALDVALLKYQSSYTNYIGERPWWALVAVTAVSVILSRRSMSRPRPSQSG